MSDDKKTFQVALAGNPNCGKTTIFNLLTGNHQHVGNYSGVTVERKDGFAEIKGVRIDFVDLPGVYSLSGASPEERVALDELQNGKIDLILNVIDSSNAQRNLYLTCQLVELGIPMLLVFNMADEAADQGLELNYQLFSQFFGAPAIPMVGSENVGANRLRILLRNLLLAEDKRIPAVQNYGHSINEAIGELSEKLTGMIPDRYAHLSTRYFALKLLEKDKSVMQQSEFSQLKPLLSEFDEKSERRHGADYPELIADRRYGIIAGACREAVSVKRKPHNQWSDQIDKIVTNRFVGLPIFLLLMYLVFLFTFRGAEPLVNYLDQFFAFLAFKIAEIWPADCGGFWREMLLNGIIPGVGGVLTFLPNILFLFLAISFLESTGYMSRAAFVMDGVMHHFGLHGKSFIPMVLGFGCSVPAIMATRTIESERDRLTTIMIVPFMSCGARLPIYSLLIPVFFAPKYQPLILFLLYSIGVAVSLVAARVLKNTLFHGDDEVFIMELPPYRLPTLRGMLIHLGERALMYLKKAGTFILAASILIFIISSFPKLPEDKIQNDRRIEQQQLEYSITGKIGHALAWVMKPAGFDWQESAALIGAFAGKELFVSQMGILYSTGDDDEGALALQNKLRASHTPLQGFCIMLFCLLAAPCVAAVAAVHKETRSWKLTLLQFCGMNLVAYVLTVSVYQIGRFFCC